MTPWGHWHVTWIIINSTDRAVTCPPCTMQQAQPPGITQEDAGKKEEMQQQMAGLTVHWLAGQDIGLRAISHLQMPWDKARSARRALHSWLDSPRRRGSKAVASACNSFGEVEDWSTSVIIGYSWSSALSLQLVLFGHDSWNSADSSYRCYRCLLRRDTYTCFSQHVHKS